MSVILVAILLLIKYSVYAHGQTRQSSVDFNVDRGGFDYVFIILPFYEGYNGCKSRCISSSRCQAWASKHNPNSGYYDCWLKDAVPGPVSLSGVYSGYIFPDGGDYSTFDVTTRMSGTLYMNYSSDNSITCMTACKDDGRCMAWNFNGVTKICSTYDSASTTSTDSYYNSGKMNCSTGYISGPATIQCFPCAVGSYQNKRVCTLCDAGKYSVSPGSTVCNNSCAAGQSSPAGSSMCFGCSAGTYAPTSSSPSCLSCPEGTLSNANFTWCDSCTNNTIIVNLLNSTTLFPAFPVVYDASTATILDVKAVSFQISGFGHLLVNYLSENFAQVQAEMRFISVPLVNFSSSTITICSTSTTRIRYVRVLALSSILHIQSIDLHVYLSTAFQPGYTYIYNLAVSSFTKAAPTSNQASFSSLSSKSFVGTLTGNISVTALTYTLESGTVTISLSPSKFNLSCRDTNPQNPGYNTINPACASMKDVLQEMPEVFVTQNILTGQFENIYVFNNNTVNNTFVFDTAQFITRILAWNDAQLPSDSSVVDDHDHHTVTLHHKSLYPVHKYYKYHHDGLGMLASRGIKHPTGKIRMTPVGDGAGGITYNGPCVEVLSTFTEQNDPFNAYEEVEDSKTDNLNTTQFTCFDPTLGPTFAHLNQTGQMGNFTVPSTAAKANNLVASKIRQLITTSDSLIIHNPSFQSGYSALIQSSLSPDGVIFMVIGKLVQTQHSALGYLQMPKQIPPNYSSAIHAIHKQTLVQSYVIQFLDKLLLWGLHAGGGVIQATIADVDDLLSFTSDSLVFDTLIVDSMRDFTCVQVIPKSHYFKDLLSAAWDQIAVNPHISHRAVSAENLVAAAIDSFGFLHAALPKLKSLELEWVRVFIMPHHQVHTSVGLDTKQPRFSSFQFYTRFDNKKWIGVATSAERVFLLKEFEGDSRVPPSISSIAHKYQHLMWVAVDVSSVLFQVGFQYIWKLGLLHLHSNHFVQSSFANLPLAAIINDGQLVVTNELETETVLLSTSVVDLITFPVQGGYEILFLQKLNQTRQLFCVHSHNLHQHVNLNSLCTSPPLGIHQVDTSASEIEPLLSRSSSFVWVYLNGGYVELLSRVSTSSPCAWQIVSHSSVSISQMTLRSSRIEEVLNNDPGTVYSGQAALGVVLVEKYKMQAVNLPLPIRAVPNNYTQFIYQAVAIYPSFLLPLNSSQVLDLMKRVLNNISNADDVFNYRDTIMEGGDDLATIVVDLCRAGMFASIYYNENITGVILDPLVSMLPPSTVASAFIYSIVSNNTYPLAVRIVALRSSWTLPCPDTLLNNYLYSIINQTYTNTSSDQELTLYAEASTAWNMFSLNNCAGSIAETLGYNKEIIRLLKLAYDTPSGAIDRFKRLLHVPCVPSKCFLPEHFAAAFKYTIDESDHVPSLQIATHHLTSTKLHRSQVQTLIQQLQHEIEEVQVAAIRALRNSCRLNPWLIIRHLGILIHRVTSGDTPRIRAAAIDTFAAISSDFPGSTAVQYTVATAAKKICDRYLAGNHRDWEDLNALQLLVGHRISVGWFDYDVAILCNRTINHLIQAPHATALSPVGFFFEKSWANAQASISFSASADRSLDYYGFSSYAMTSGDVSILGHEFNVVRAGMLASWNSAGVVSFVAYTTVTILGGNLFSRYFYDYYLLFYSFATMLPIGLQGADPCSLDAPPLMRPGYGLTKTFFETRYYYGIPIIGDLEMGVTIAGSVELNYGVVLVFNPINANFSNMTIKGYVTPRLNLQGRAQASANLLIIRAGIQGSVTVVDASVPLVAAYNTNYKNLGYAVPLVATLLEGNIDAFVEYRQPRPCTGFFDCIKAKFQWVWYQQSYRIFQWIGSKSITPLAVPRLICQNATWPLSNSKVVTSNNSYAIQAIFSGCSLQQCWPLQGALKFDASFSDICCGCTLSPAVYSYLENTDQLLQYVMRPEFCNSQYCRSNYPSTRGAASVEPADDDDGCLNQYAPKLSESSVNFIQSYIQRKFMYLNEAPFVPLAIFAYDCISYPWVCTNTYCYFEYLAPNPDGGKKNQQDPNFWTNTFRQLRDADGSSINRYNSLKDLPTAAAFNSISQDRDEVPMASWDSGGSGARIAAINYDDNRRHGGKVGGHYRKYSIGWGKETEFDFSALVPTAGHLKYQTRADCCNKDFRIQQSRNVYAPSGKSVVNNGQEIYGCTYQQGNPVANPFQAGKCQC